MDIIKSIEHEQLKNKIPELKVGNTVKVHVRIKEGNKERIQVFEGIIIKVQGGGVNQTFTVRKTSYGVGVEKTFLIHSPLVGRDVSTVTLYNYLEALCKALIIRKVYRYDIHGRAVLKTLNKYYMTDLGIAQIKNNNFDINRTFALENVVYNELITRGYDVYIGKTKKR